MTQQTILIVEDDPTFARTLAQALKLGSEASYQVSTCLSAEEAYQFLEENKIDLLVSEYNLPGEDGMSLIANIRTRNPDLLTVLITESGDQAQECQAHSGTHGCLTKPFDMLDLLLIVQKVSQAQKGQPTNGTLAILSDQARQFSILILEDDAGLRTIYSRALSKSSCYLIDEASTLDEARQLLNLRDYDILISDMRIGRDRATDVLSEYGERFEIFGTKVVMCSAFGQYRNLPARVDHFLEKPISLERLVSLVSQLTETRRVSPC